jgi:hypothetical protein
MDELDDYARQFRDARDHARRLAGGLSRDQVNWRPAPGKWSIAECISHLSVTGRAVCAKSRDAIARGRERGWTGQGPFAYGWLARWFESSMEPPPRRRWRTSAVFAPTSGSDHSVDAVLEEFDAVGAEYLACLELARGLDLARIRVASPVSALIRFPLGGYFRAQTAHERRHLWQADQVAKAPGFPAR